ncbi:acyltransferase [Pseudomonas sp. PB3P13]
MERETHFWIHCVKAIAIVMVVVLHVTAPYHYQYNEMASSSWSVVNVYEAIVRPCVPLFFMSSGFLLLGFDESAINFILKRINRVLLPLAFWTAIYVIWIVYYHKQRYVDFGGVYQMFFYPVSYHLWFMYAIVGCYLCLPIVRKLTTCGHSDLLYYYCAIWFCAVAIMPLLQKHFSLKNQIDLSYATGYLGYFLLGYLFGTRTYSKRHAIIAFLFVVLSTWITGYATSVLTSENNGTLVSDFTSNFSPSVIIASVAWFVLIKSVCSIKLLGSYSRCKSMVVSLSEASFGVYLVHVILVNLVGDFCGNYYRRGADNFIWMLPFISLVVLICSYVLVIICKRNYYMKKFVGF